MDFRGRPSHNGTYAMVLVAYNRGRYSPLTRLLGCATIASLIVGCSSGLASSSTEWEKPGWMVQEIANRKARQDYLQSCLEGKGWDIYVHFDGMINLDGWSREEAEPLIRDSENCMKGSGLLPEPFEPTTEDFRREYRMNLDVRSCLIDQGIRMAEPPSEDDWIATRSLVQASETTTSIWLPYTDPAIRASNRRTELEQICPQVNDVRTAITNE